jgi:Protein of unknown function (DUF3303)
VTDDNWKSLGDYPERVEAEAILGLLAADGLPCYIASNAHVPGLGSVFSVRVPAALLARAQALIEHGPVSDAELTELALAAPGEESAAAGEATLYMIVETFLPGAAADVYRRARSRGRMLPPGLEYLDSWVDLEFSRCFQLMRTGDRRLIDTWIASWSDLVRFEVVAVRTSAEATRAIAARL